MGVRLLDLSDLLLYQKNLGILTGLAFFTAAIQKFVIWKLKDNVQLNYG
jgi:hypothetical protein